MQRSFFRDDFHFSFRKFTQAQNYFFSSLTVVFFLKFSSVVKRIGLNLI